MKSTRAFRKYLIVYAATATLCLLGVAAFCIVVDPYDIHRVIRLPGVNENKPLAQSHIRLTKAYAISRIKPRAVVIGTSRVEFGMSPDHPGWERSARPTYNLALPGANIYEVYRYLQHAHAHGPLQQAVVGFDLVSFSLDRGNRHDFLEGRLTLPRSKALSGERLRDKVSSILTMDALRDAYQTTIRQAESSPLLENGMRVWNEEAYTDAVKAAGGVVNIMRKREHADFQRYLRLEFENEAGDSSLETFRRLVQFTYDEDIEVFFFFSPCHARQWELLDASGRWGDFETLKRAVVSIVAEEAAKSNKTAHKVWDFSGYNEVTSEAVPAEGTFTRMNGYWESSHYKPQVGHLVLNRVLGYDLDNVPPTFGRQIDATNLDLALEEIRDEREIWRARNPTAAKEMLEYR